MLFGICVLLILMIMIKMLYTARCMMYGMKGGQNQWRIYTFERHKISAFKKV